MASTREPRTLERLVLGYLRRQGVPPGARILVAFSGGPDSRALLETLRAAAPLHPCRLWAAYLDHGLRPRAERQAELDFVRRCCTREGVGLTVGRLPPGRLRRAAAAGGSSLEEMARRYRYRFLRRACRATGSDFLALGHTLDDHAETLTMRFFQGSGAGGLRGIPERRGRLLRPLRRASRAEVLAYLRGRRLRYRVDTTNRDPGFLRNAVRQRLLPAAEALFPGYRRSLAALSGKMRLLQAFVRREAAARLQWRPERTGFSIDGPSFFAAPRALRLTSLLLQVNRLDPGLRRLPHRFVAGLGKAPGEGSREVLLRGHGLLLRRRGQRLFLERDIVGVTEKGYFIAEKIACTVLVPEAGLLVHARERGDERDGVVGPLIFRSARPDDRIRIRDGYKPIRKFFSEWKIPCSERWKVPIVVDRRGVLAVLGGPLGHKDRFRHALPEPVRRRLRDAVKVSVAEEP